MHIINSNICKDIRGEIYNFPVIIPKLLVNSYRLCHFGVYVDFLPNFAEGIIALFSALLGNTDSNVPVQQESYITKTGIQSRNSKCAVTFIADSGYTMIIEK